MSVKIKCSVFVFMAGVHAAIGFTVPYAISRPSLHRHPPPLSMAKRGKGLSIEGGGSNKLNKPKSISSSKSEGPDSKQPFWVPTSIKSIAALPKESNVVKLVDTGVPALVNKQTNPGGAVSIVNRDGQTYCFAASCPSCQIPMAKATVLDPTAETGADPRLACDFCGSTYNMRTGAPVKKEKGKMLGFLFSKSEDKTLPVYGLGEQKGKVFVNIP